MFRKSANEGGNIVSPTHHPSLPPGDWVDPQNHSVGERFKSMKIPNTPSGTETASLWLGAQWLNQLRHHVIIIAV